MPELADRIPGEIIFASYNNQQRDRLVERYVDATARSVSTPSPVSGTVSYLTSTNIFSIFDGLAWIDFRDVPTQDATDDAQDVRLDLLETTVLSPFTATPQSLSQTPAKVAEITVPSDGDYYLFFNGAVDFDITLGSGLSLAPIGAQFRVNGSLGEDIGVWGDSGEGKHATALSLAWTTDPGGVTAGDTIEVWLDVTSGSVISPQVREYILRADKMPAGVVQPPE